MKKITILLALMFFIVHVAFAQEAAKIYPSNWWVGMKWNKVQLMLHGKDISKATGFLINYPGVQLKQVHKVESNNYVFLDVVIGAQAKPGTVKIAAKGLEGQNLSFELKPRRKGNGTLYAQGVRSNDFIYLAMPDRFSNGDPGNDRVAGMKDQSLNRSEIFDRHGGDLQGILNHLDYIQGLGVTTLWLTPVLENDMPNRTEHGYACTDHYTIDPRLGGAKAYYALSDSLHARGMKLIQDIVYNHVGLQHFTVQDPPMKDWLHQWPGFTHPNYRDQTLFDPYASRADYEKMVNGWFTQEMPDLNQSNPYVANFLIQHALWCVEEFGVDGWRIDTYIYIDQAFMNRCNQALLDEYPKITMFGEVWVRGTANQAFFTKNKISVNPKSNAIGVADFQSLFFGIQPAAKNPPDGVNDLYQTLSNDFLYENPMNNVIFLDNHDMTRFFSEVNEDIAKLKMGIGWLLTERGIPQLYYGTEVRMKGIKNPDGWVRLDFPGGWAGDTKNAFTGSGMNEDEKSVLDYTRRLGQFRKTSSAIKTGKLMQFVPEQGIYVYFRYDNNQTLFCAMNSNTDAKNIDWSRFAERTGGFANARDVITGTTVSISDSLSVPGKTTLILELLKK